MSWYYLRGLAQADETTRASWVECVAGMGQDAVPGLIDLLQQTDARICANSEAALAAIAKQWGPADERTAALAEEITAHVNSFSTPGREAALEWHLAMLHDPEGKRTPPAAMIGTGAKLLTATAKAQDKGTRVRTLALAELILAGSKAAPVDLCRELATEGLASNDAEIRSRAVRLVMHAPLHTDKVLLEKVVAFLKDPAPQVRRAAVLTVGMAEDTIGIQDMLALLHDSDPDVRRLCEQALRGRGLQDDHIQLAIKISHPLPGERVKVVNLLPEIEDLDPQQWLMHLSQDTSPAVRAAAIRFAAEEPAAVDFRERMLQMSRDDPSPTVRQLASYYLKVYRR
jgi:HEAT repeat protein